MSAATAVVAFVQRPASASIRGLALLALGVIFVMAAFGAALATGALPVSLAPLQYAWLSLFCSLNALLVQQVSGARAPPVRSPATLGSDS